MAHLLTHDLKDLKALLGQHEKKSHVVFDAACEVDFKARLDTFCDKLVWKAYPGELYVADVTNGGSMSLLLDATLDSTSSVYAETDMSFVVLGSPGRKKEILEAVLVALGDRYGAMHVRAVGSCVTVLTRGWDFKD